MELLQHPPLGTVYVLPVCELVTVPEVFRCAVFAIVPIAFLPLFSTSDGWWLWSVITLSNPGTDQNVTYVWCSFEPQNYSFIFESFCILRGFQYVPMFGNDISQ